MKRIMCKLKECADDNLEIECMMYSNKHGMLSKSNGAENMLDIIKMELV